MIRTFEEMEADNKLLAPASVISFQESLVLAIVAGDYLRARRRRFPLNMITNGEEDIEYNLDRFAQELMYQESKETCARDLFIYSHINDASIFYIFNGLVEYLE